MRVLRSVEAWEGAGCVAAVGNFDGVHVAHRQLLQAVRAEASALGLPAVAVSFEPHPSRILVPHRAPLLLTPGEEKIRLLAAAGLDALLLLPFTRDLSLLSPRQFVARVLVEGLGVRSLHEGENFRFGHQQKGTAETLKRLGREYGFPVRLHPEVRVRGETVSSSRIRALIAAGEVGRARWLLGRAPAVCGQVAAGRGIGSRQTVPTLNLGYYAELLPAAGVYLSCVEIEGAALPALTNVGVRPTFGPDAPLTVESHVLHPPRPGLTAGPGAPLRVSFLRRLREERRFDSPEALRERILADIAQAEVFFRRLGVA